MKAKKSLALMLLSALMIPVLTLGAFAADGEETAKKLSTGALVSLIILGVVVVVLIILAIVKREKLAEALRSYKSEMKKITWYPWKQVWRNTVLVIVVVLVAAAVVGLLDFAFFQGQAGLVKLFGGNG